VASIEIQYVKVDSPFCRAKFRECYERCLRIRVTTTIEFILVLSLRWSLNASGADSSLARFPLKLIIVDLALVVLTHRQCL